MLAKPEPPNTLLHENNGKIAKIIRINFIRTLEIKQQPKDHLFKKNIWSSVRTLSFVILELALFPCTSSQLCVALKTKSLQFQWKPAAWQPPERTEWNWNSFKASFIKNCHDLTYLVVPWETPGARMASFDWLRIHPVQKPFPQDIYLKQLEVIV